MVKSITKLCCLIAFICACKKDDPIPDPYADVPKTGTRTELTLDSIYLYAHETWLWNDALPDYLTFNPRKFANDGTTPAVYEKELSELLKYKVNPATGLPYEYAALQDNLKYSFLDEGNSETGMLAQLSLTGYGDGYGFDAAQYMDALRVKYVYPESPAALANLHRGDKIIAMGTSSVDNHLNMTVEKGDGSIINLNLLESSYTSSTIFKTKIITSGANSVGYLSIGQFVTKDILQPELEPIFQQFSTNNIRHLIVDLRYNSGGYVSSAECLANFISPSNISGKVMYTEHFNDQMQQGKALILQNQPYYNAAGEQVTINGRLATYLDVDYTVANNTYKFAKEGRLEDLEHVYFIVSGQTASAAEMLINCLKPYLPVTLIGTTTYGKPVGFFTVHIDQYNLYLSSFQIKNAAHEGDYFEGFDATIGAKDDLRYDFGDPREECLAKTLELINKGISTLGSSKNNHLPPKLSAKRMSLKSYMPKMIEDRMKLKN